jgi:hypothetical protein
MNSRHFSSVSRLSKRLSSALLSPLSETAAILIACTTLSTAQTVQTLSPESNGSPAAAGDLALQITYDVDVSVGSGNVTITDLDTFNVVASFDIADPADATVSGNTVTFATFTAIGGAQYNVEAPAGFVVATAGGALAPGLGFNPGDGIWVFEVVAPDTTGPAIVSLSPQNGFGASVSPALTVTFDENLTLSTDPWTIEVYDVTAGQVLESFSETDTGSVTTLSTGLSISFSGNLEFNNEYRVTASAGVVTDGAGNPSAEITSGDWQFTTGGAFAGGQVVISQVFGGGGNAGAPVRNDYVELYNRSSTVISLEGWAVQYTSRAGSNWGVTPLSGSIQPGGYYLVQQSAGSNTTASPLPTPDATGTSTMSGTGGKVALTNLTDALTVADPFTAGVTSLSDFVGYGTAAAFEGSAATPSVGNTLAAFRKVNGSQDTNDNAADFASAAPAPRNGSSPTFVPGNDGSGIASITNVTPTAGILQGKGIFPSDTAAQTLQVDLTGTLADVEIDTVEIDVPADFGTLAESNISISGAGAGTGSAALSGQTITVSGVALTTAEALVVTIADLTTPDVGTVPADGGERTFTVRTSTAGGSPTELVASPSVTIAVPVANLAELRTFDPSDKTFLIPSEVLVTFFDPALSFRNQHYVQDSSAGILIDDSPFKLGASYDLGDGLTNLLGKISTFNGILQFNPALATPSASSIGNEPQPIVATLAELTASPETYESRLVRVNAVTFQDSAGSFVNNIEGVLVQGGDTFGLSPFTGADYIGTAIPSASLDLVGISRPLLDGVNSGVSPRTLADFIGDNIFPDPGNGSGLASATNSSPAAGSLTGSTVFPSLTASQTVQLNLNGTLAATTIETIEIDVPADFGTLSGANVSISGAAAGTGSASLTGRTITVSGVAMTDADFLVVSIAGLTTPDVSTDPNDDGRRTFAVRTAVSAGTPRALAALPQARIAIPVADLATLRAVALPSTKAYLIPNEAIVAYVASGNFRNQHYIQDSTAGILIDDQPVTLGTSYLAGDGLTNLVGGISSFGGMLQFTPIAATTNIASSGNTTVPIGVTLAELTANPLTYQSRLIKVSGVTFQDPTGNFANNDSRILVQGSDPFGFRTFFNSDYSGAPIPASSVDVVGIVHTVSDVSYLSSRALSDITEAETGGDPIYQDFADQFAGGQTDPNLDFDGDGVRNGLEYLFGVNSAGVTPTQQIVDGAITWPIDPARTDVGFVVETSGNLVDWDPVLVGDLDLTDPNSVRFVVPTGTQPLFVRIGATFQ